MLKKIRALFGGKQQDLIKKVDLLFGKMRFIEFKDKSKQYWECEGFFEPTGEIITFLIANSTKEGPDDKQRDFYRQIVKNFNKTSLVIQQKTNYFLSETYSNYIPTASFNEGFKVKDISLFNEISDPRKWDISFSPRNSSEWFYITVHMKGHEVLNIEVES